MDENNEDTVWHDSHGRPELIAEDMFMGTGAPMVRFTDPERDAAVRRDPKQG